MAVIITNMDKPVCCSTCGIVPSKFKGVCGANGCPLKSVDEMIKEIEQIVAEEKINDPKWALGLKYSLRIIHKYCDKGPGD